MFVFVLIFRLSESSNSDGTLGVSIHAAQTEQYALLHPQYTDLIGDAGASELFFVDGDSLLLDLLASRDANIDWSYGGQFLHLVFLVERYLGWFKQRGGNFRVVFFDCNRALWLKSGETHDFKTWSRLAARESVIRHLQTNTDVLIDIFDSWLDEAPMVVSEDKWNWNRALQMYPAFVAVSDGECLADKDPEAAFVLRSFLFSCSSRRNATVFTSSVSVHKNRVMGFVVRYGSRFHR